jgi:hypothetical protein
MDDPSTWAATRSRNGAGDVKRDGASGVYRCRRDSPDGLEGIRPVLKTGGEESRKKPSRQADDAHGHDDHAGWPWTRLLRPSASLAFAM